MERILRSSSIRIFKQRRVLLFTKRTGKTVEVERTDWKVYCNHREKCIAAIWEEALELPRVGLHENFFDLGGHSLITVRIIARIRESLGVTLDLGVVFEAPTVAELSRRVEQAIEDI